MLTGDAVSTAPGLRYGFYAVVAVYVVLTAVTVYVLRRLAGHHEENLAPQEPSRPTTTTGGADDARPRRCWPRCSSG